MIQAKILPPALMAVTTLRGPWREVLFWGVGSLLGSITALLTGAILSPLINKYKSGLLGTSVDDQAGLTLLVIAAALSAALYNYYLKGPILIGAALVSNVSISIIFELDVVSATTIITACGYGRWSQSPICGRGCRSRASRRDQVSDCACGLTVTK